MLADVIATTLMKPTASVRRPPPVCGYIAVAGLLACAATVTASEEIQNAVIADDIGQVRIILASNPSAVSDRDVSGSTALHWAVRNKQMVELLLRNGADPNARDGSGETPLTRTVTAENAALLIKAGADVNTKDNSGSTPLHWKGVGDNSEVASMLLKSGATLEPRDDEGRTPLAIAALHGSHRVLTLLLAKGSDIEATDKMGRTPLFHAVGRYWPKNWSETGQILFDHGANINAQDKDGATPLHFACSATNVDAVAWLLTHGASPSAKNKFGQTPLAGTKLSRSMVSGLNDPKPVIRESMTNYAKRLDEIITLLKNHGGKG
jgi:ankyrin repeat protein